MIRDKNEQKMIYAIILVKCYLKELFSRQIYFMAVCWGFLKKCHFNAVFDFTKSLWRIVARKIRAIDHIRFIMNNRLNVFTIYELFEKEIPS